MMLENVYICFVKNANDGPNQEFIADLRRWSGKESAMQHKIYIFRDVDAFVI